MPTLKEHPMEDVIAEMRQEFGAFWSCIFGDSRLLDPTWSKVCRSYGEPHRAYHTLQHVQEMLHLLESLTFKEKLSMDDHLVLSGAIWFHDIVYRTTEQAVLSPLTNEELSAAYAFQTMADAWGHTHLHDAHKIAQLVLSTAFPQDEVLGTMHEYMHDLDYAILATFSDDRLREYDDQIRKEWDHIPLEHYLTHRKAFLTKLKEQGSVFCSFHFETSLGDRSLENIDTLLEWVAEEEKK